MHRFLPILGRIYVFAVFAFIFLPLILILIISFSADSYLSFPPSGFSLKWYASVFANQAFMYGLWHSVVIAIAVTIISQAFGLPAAWAIVRLDFPGKNLVRTFVLAPLLLPMIVLGIGILMIFTRLQLIATYPGLIAAHLVVTLPFTIRILETTMANLGIDVEHAAMTLGARPLQVFFHITLPRLVPGIIASGAIAAIMSFDEVMISLFIVGARLSTLPVEIYRYVDERTDPMVAVLAVLLIVISLGIVLVVERSIGFARTFGRS